MPKKTKPPTLPKLIDAIVFDFDGVMTPNTVIVLQDGTEAVICSRSDGWGIGNLKRAGFKVLVLSTEPNPVVSARCKKLGLECIQGSKDKGNDLETWAKQGRIDLKRTVYVGNDENDLPALTRVGVPAVVADAHPSVMKVKKLWKLASSGGQGAVRELADHLIAKCKPSPRT